MAILKPFQLLEINIISAQDLEHVSKKMKTYAVAWVNRNRKLSSRVDSKGNMNPTWNDKFVFRVDEEFLRRDTSAVMIEIYDSHWFRDTLVGTVRILVGNLIPPPAQSHNRRQRYGGMRFVALQVRRPSGRPQGILNIGVAVLDSSMRSMPLYAQCASAVGFNDLMDDPNLNNHRQNGGDEEHNNNQAPALKPILRRSKSEHSELIHLDNYSDTNSSLVAIPKKMGNRGNGRSMLSISEVAGDQTFVKSKNKKGKASSVISGAELRKKPNQKGKKLGKASSVVSDSIVSKETTVYGKTDKPDLNSKGQENLAPELKVFDEKPPVPTIAKPISKLSGHEQKGSKFFSWSPIQSSFDFLGLGSGPPPSEVAAMMAERKYPLDDNQSSVLDGWSLDESVEGLKSKLERWRMELPPVYDRGFSTSSYQSRSSSQPTRRKADKSSLGLFSCFGNICGYECECVCGKPPGRSMSSTRFRSPATTPGRSFF